jgi:hypothetical protein
VPLEVSAVFYQREMGDILGLPISTRCQGQDWMCTELLEEALVYFASSTVEVIGTYLLCGIPVPCERTGKFFRPH